jgi:hypothetical protein
MAPTRRSARVSSSQDASEKRTVSADVATPVAICATATSYLAFRGHRSSVQKFPFGNGAVSCKAASSQAPNEQLQRTVIPNRWRAARAPFHYAHAARWTRGRAAAELRRTALELTSSDYRGAQVAP